MDHDEEARGTASDTTRGTIETEPGWRSRQARAVGDEPEWATWRWFGGGERSTSGGERSGSGGGRSFSLLGVFLVLVGVGLLIQLVQPAISLTSLILLALGVAFGAVWLIGGVRGAFVPAAFLVALALARLVVELGLATGDGWTALFLGIGLSAVWAVGRWQGARRDWALWLGMILVLIGLAQISLRVAGSQEFGLLWPALIILIGGALLLRSRASGALPDPSRRRRG